MMRDHFTISLPDQEQILQATGSQSLLDLLRQYGLPVHAPCGGQGKCRNCRVQVRATGSGDASWQSVLACQTRINADLDLRLPRDEAVRIQAESYFPDIPLAFNPPQAHHYGFGVDIGTTTVVVWLEDLNHHRAVSHSSFINPQQAYGADVISRIHYASRPEQAEELAAVILKALNQAFVGLLQQHQLQTDQISEVTVTGNTTMLHLLTRTPVSSLAVFPFEPVFTEEKTLRATEAGLHLHPNTQLTLLPAVSAFVGADIAGGLAATDLADREGYALFLDIGTNGEMALGNKDRLLCCATAAGPAFEGARISCGLGGVSGAVHRFADGTFETIGQAAPRGLCGSGLIDVIAWMLDSGMLDPSGYLDQPAAFLPRHGLELTPQDIREVQLAKGAIAAGIDTLLHHADVDPASIDRVFLAGGFGYAIDPGSAIRIGLLPETFRHKIIRAGNTAGLGARLYLHSQDFRRRTASLLERARPFDLSADPFFNEQFVMHMPFPA